MVSEEEVQSTGFATFSFAQDDKWKCNTCCLRWEASLIQCKACESYKPGLTEDEIAAIKAEAKSKQDSLIAMFRSAPAASTGSGFSFAASSSGALTSTAASGFSFGATSPAPASGFNFGVGSQAPSAFNLSFGASSSSTSPPSLNFGAGSQSTGGFAFGASSSPPLSTGSFVLAASTSSPQSGFSFGSTSSQPSGFSFGSSENAGGFVFGAAPSAKLHEKQLSALPDFSREERLVGDLFVHGSGECDQLGLGDEQRERQKPTIIRSLSGLKVCDLAVGALHVLCVTAGGKIYSWGCNDDGALGRPSDGDSDCEPHLADLPDGVVARKISCGDCHSCSLDSLGRVWLWGSYKDSNGHIGIALKRKSGEVTEKSAEPAIVLEGCIEIVSGANHTLALAASAKVFSWGSNGTGQLGLQNGEGCGFTEKQILNTADAEWRRSVDNLKAREGGGVELDGLRVVRIITSSAEKLVMDAKVHEVKQQIGAGTTAIVLEVPEREVPKPEKKQLLTPQIVSTINIKANVANIFASNECTFAIADGRSYGCGLNGDGQVGLGFPSMAVLALREIPGLEGVSWIGGGLHTSAALANGAVLTWGKAEECGHGSTTQRLILQPKAITALPKIRTLRCGGHHMLATSKAGDVFAWGCGLTHQLGNRPRDFADPADKDEDPDDELAPYRISSKQLESRFVFLADGGAQHSVELAWDNTYEKLAEIMSDTCSKDVDPSIEQPAAKRLRPAEGDLLPAETPSPFTLNIEAPQPASIPTFVFGAPQASSATTSGFTFGAPQSSSATTSGFTFGAPLASSTAASGFIFGAPPEPLKLKEKELASLPDFTRIEMPVGDVFVHGSGECDQLGLGDEQRERQKPTIIRSLSGVKVCDLAVGALHVLCVTTGGSIYSWGCNDDGALGRPSDGDSDCEPHLVNLPSGVVARKISCGDCHSCSLDSVGRVWLWGTYKDSNGHIGIALKRKNGEVVEKSADPSIVLEGCSQIASGANHSLALGASSSSETAPRVFAWGSNGTGQLGLSSGEGCGFAEKRKSMSEVSLDDLKPRVGGGVDLEGLRLVRTISASGSEKLVMDLKLSEVKQKLQTDASAIVLETSEREVPKPEKKTLLYPQHISVDDVKGTISSIFASAECTFAIAAGKAYGCGLNGDGQVGLGFCSMVVLSLRELPGLGEATWMGGGLHTSAALTKDGKIFTWGKAEECGHGATSEKLIMQPKAVARLPKIRMVRCGGHHTIATSEAGDVFAWGCGLTHQLGNRPRDFANPSDKDEDPEDELAPYRLSSKQLETRFVLAADAGAQHSVELAWDGTYQVLSEPSAEVSMQQAQDEPPAKRMKPIVGVDEEDASMPLPPLPAPSPMTPKEAMENASEDGADLKRFLAEMQDTAKDEAMGAPSDAPADVATTSALTWDLSSVDHLWKCDTCSLRWEASLVQCKACESYKPGLSADEIAAMEAAAKKKQDDLVAMFRKPASSTASSGFAFGGGESTATSTGFSFGNALTPAASTGFSFGAGGSTTSTGGFQFGGSSTATSSGFSFGGQSSGGLSFGCATPTPSVFSFGTATSPSMGFTFGDSSSASSSGFSFGNASATASSNPLSFGADSSTMSSGGFSLAGSSATSTSGFVFGASQQIDRVEKKLDVVPDFARDDVPIGDIFVHGSGECDQLGLGDDNRERQKPSLIRSLSGLQIFDVAVGALHVLCLTAAGTLYSWGCNDDGALGRPSDGDNDCEPHLANLPAGTAARSISCGDCHSCALDRDGRVWLWGTYKDSNGHIGIASKGGLNPVLEKTSEPAVVLDGCAQIASGANHTLALKASEKKVFAWGSNGTGQLGLSHGEGCAYAEHVRPVSDVPLEKLVARVGGGVDFDGMRVVRIVQSSGLEKQVMDLKLEELRSSLQSGVTAVVLEPSERDLPKSEKTKLLVPQIVDMASVPAGASHVFASAECTFVVAEGKVYGCGLNGDCQVGLGFASMVVRTLREVQGLEGVTWIGGGLHSSAALVKGQVFTWGKAEETGHGLDAKAKPLVHPKAIPDLPKIRTLRCGGHHTLATSEAGDVFTWGCGLTHQLGNRPRDFRNPTDKDEDAEDELRPYQVSSKQLETRYVLLADGGAQHSVELAWDGKYQALVKAGSSIQVVDSSPALKEPLHESPMVEAQQSAADVSVEPPAKRPRILEDVEAAIAEAKAEIAVAAAEEDIAVEMANVDAEILRFFSGRLLSEQFPVTSPTKQQRRSTETLPSLEKSPRILWSPSNAKPSSIDLQRLEADVAKPIPSQQPSVAKDSGRRAGGLRTDEYLQGQLACFGREEMVSLLVEAAQARGSEWIREAVLAKCLGDAKAGGSEKKADSCESTDGQNDSSK